MKCELCHLMEKLDAYPDFIVPNLLRATKLVSHWVGHALKE